MTDFIAAAAKLAATRKYDPKQAQKHDTKVSLTGRPPSVISSDFPSGAPSMNVWEIALHPGDSRDAAFRECLLRQVRGALERKLCDDPQAQELTWRTPLGTVEVRPRGGRNGGGPLQLAFAPGVSDLAATKRLTSGEPDSEALPALRVPNEPAFLLGQRLVGLEASRRNVLLQWRCRWDGALDGWSQKTGSPVPAALQEQLQTGHALWVFDGDPGTGKSALARVLADDYAWLQGIGGTVLWLTTQARGQGLVGDFSRRLRAAFSQLSALPENELKLLIVDEADALAMRRSEAQSHQEDKAATSTLIQALDETAGLRRLAVILTTNSAGSVDPAVLRRARLVAFGRPDLTARLSLLARWLPQLTPRELDAAARASDAMTPADIDRALGEAWLSAVGGEASLAAEAVVAVLRSAPRTGAV